MQLHVDYKKLSPNIMMVYVEAPQGSYKQNKIQAPYIISNK